MFQDLFNRYLKRSQSYERLKDQLNHLEKEVDRLRNSKPAPPQPHSVTSQIAFPPTLTININKKGEDTPPIKSFTKKINMRPKKKLIDPTPSQIVPDQPPPVSGEPEPKNGSLLTPPSQPTYIEFLNIETIIVDRYEQSNNFGALGIKSLEGKLNIGANYGDKSDMPEDAKKKLEEKLKAAKDLMTYKESENDSSNSSKPKKKTEPTIKLPFNEYEVIETMEDFYDWDDFFTNQPKDADNNQ